MALEKRTEARVSTGAQFVTAYVEDIISHERRTAEAYLTGADITDKFTQVVRVGAYDAAVLLDADGRALAVEPKAPAVIGTAIAQKYPHLSGAVAGRPTVSPVVASAAEGIPVVGFAVPFETPSGRRVFSGALHVGDGTLADFLARSTPFSDATTVLVDANGNIVADPKGVDRKLTAFADAYPPLAAVATQKGSGRESIDGTEKFWVAHEVEGTPWRSVFAVPVDELYAPISGTKSGVDWALGLAACLGLGSALVLGERRRNQRRELAATEERWRLTLDNAPIGIAILSLDGRWIRVNAALCRILGYSEAELLERTFVDITHPDDVETDTELNRRVLAGEIPRYQLEKRYLDARGRVVWASLSVALVRDDDGRPIHFISQISDVTSVKRVHDTLLSKASHDVLTGLPNRSVLADRMTDALRSAEEETTGVAVLFCDLDSFKPVNDTLGHAAGDAVLTEVAARLRRVVRPDDVVARIGGDEFVIVGRGFPGEPAAIMAAAHRLADRVREAISAPYRVAGTTATIGVSIGVTIAEPSDTPDDLIGRADALMYDVKNRSRTMPVRGAAPRPPADPGA